MNTRMRTLAAAVCGLLALSGVLRAEPVPLFDGSDSYVDLGTPDALQIPSNEPFTVEGWMLFNALSTRDMLYCKSAGRTSAYSYLLGFADGKLAAYNTAWRGSFAVSRQLDRWYHVAFSFDGADMAFYLDGALLGTAAFSYNNNLAHTVKIGGFSSTSDIDGSLSDVRVWDHARTQSEILQAMSNRLTGADSGLLGYWPLDEGSGTNVYDRTAAAGDGILIGAAWTNNAALSERITGEMAFAVARPFTLADIQTGSPEFTNSNEVDVAAFPVPEAFDRYQVTFGGEPSAIDPNEWISTNDLPGTMTFAPPPADTNVTFHAWFTNTAAAVTVARAEGSIFHTRTNPVPVARSTHSRALISGQPVAVHPVEIDNGSTGGSSGERAIPIHAMALTLLSGPDTNATPDEPFVTVSELGTYAVSLVVMNAAGNVATSSVCQVEVTAYGGDPFVWTGAFDGDWHNPLNWDLNMVPVAGSEVVIGSGSVLLASATAELDSFTMSGGTLTFTNWQSSLRASEMQIQGDAVLTTPEVAVDGEATNRVYLLCGNLALGSNAQINVDEKGYGGGWNSSGKGPGIGYSAGHGGRGGDNFSYLLGGPVYGEAAAPLGPGSGGKSTDARSGNLAGNGGGSVRIIATGHVSIDGSITADGGASSGYSGCGSGGAIWITCRTFGGGGVLRAEGKDGRRGGGGGGRIAVTYDAAAQAALPVPRALFSVRGGLTTDGARRQDADIGTLYFTDTQFLTPVLKHSGQLMFASDPAGLSFESLTVENAWLRFQDRVEYIVVQGDLVVDGVSARLDIGGSGYYTSCGAWRLLNTASTSAVVHVGGNLSLTNGGAMFVHPACARAASLDVAGSLVISSGSRFRPFCHPTNGMSVVTSCRNLVVLENGGIDAVGAGFAGGLHSEGLGPGGVRYGGGGYGGTGGGATDTRPGGPVYGDPDAPVLAGSGGGSWDARVENYGGYGGGLVRVVATEECVLDGFVDVFSGLAGTGYNSAGSGGGIYLESRQFGGAASGLLRADGGERSGLGGGGGGGRIAIVFGARRTEATPPHRMLVSPTPPGTFSGSASVRGGTGAYEDGEDGTVRFIRVLYPQGTVLLLR